MIKKTLKTSIERINDIVIDKNEKRNIQKNYFNLFCGKKTSSLVGITILMIRIIILIILK